MQVKEIMTKQIEGIRHDETVREAAIKMKNLDIGVLPVWRDKDCVGMLTDRDIVVRGIASGKNPSELRAEEVMSPEIVRCTENDSVDDAAAIMAQAQVRRLAVVNENEKLVGILSLGDVATNTREMQRAGQALRGVSEPA